MSDNDVIVVNENEKQKKVAKTKFGRFLQKNKINLILILVSLIFIGSVIFTYVRGKISVKQEGAETTEVVSTSSFLQRNAVVNNLYLYLYPKTDAANLVVPTQSITQFTSGQYYTWLTFNTGEQVQSLYLSDTDTFNLFLYEPSTSDDTLPNKWLIASYDTSGSDLEYKSTNSKYTYISYSDEDTFTYVGYVGESYLSFFEPERDNSYNLPEQNLTLTFGSFGTGYNQGLQEGEANGVSKVVNSPSDYDLYTEAQVRVLKDEAFDDGKNYAFSQMNDFNLKTLVFTILEAPSKLLDMFNFEIFGINFKVIVTFLISIALVLFVIGLFKRG